MNRNSIRRPRASEVGRRVANSRPAILAWVALLLPLASTLPAIAQDEARAISNERCLGCHDDDTLTAEDGRSMLVHESGFSASKHRRLDCTTCHADALSTRHPRNKLGAVPVANCERCHAEELAPLRESVHAKKATPEAERSDPAQDAMATCIPCRGARDSKPRCRQ